MFADKTQELRMRDRGQHKLCQKGLYSNDRDYFTNHLGFSLTPNIDTENEHYIQDICWREIVHVACDKCIELHSKDDEIRKNKKNRENNK